VPKKKVKSVKKKHGGRGRHSKQAEGDEAQKSGRDKTGVRAVNACDRDHGYYNFAPRTRSVVAGC
jgi:hypothetical protein